jgi:hypothetical protein
LARDVLVLVEAERTLHTTDVRVTTPVVVLIVEIHAYDKPVGAVEPEAIVAVVQTPADELAFEVDDPERGESEVLVLPVIGTDEQIRQRGGRLTAFNSAGQPVVLTIDSIPDVPVISILPTESLRGFGPDGQTRGVVAMMNGSEAQRQSVKRRAHTGSHTVLGTMLFESQP